jgi:cation diffusion facilitator family transporter
MAIRTRSVIAATLSLDTAFFIANFLVFYFGGSRAVLSQALYTITDVIAGVMIYWGVKVSLEPPTHTHPFGRGKERFFWAFTAGLVTFSVAGFLVLVEGILEIMSPVHIIDLPEALATVAATLVASLVSLAIVLEEIREQKVTFETIMESEHQEIKMILVQDIVSMMGAGVALTGILLVYMTGNVLYDGLAASVVGALLVGTGFVFAMDAREFLVGKGVSAEDGKTILSIVERYPFVRQVQGMQSMLMGPDEVLVGLRVNFVNELTTDDVEMHIDQLRQFVTGEFPRIKHLLIEPVAEYDMTVRSEWH